MVADHMDIVELLATKPADLNIKNTDGFTPLHYAVSTRCLSWWETQIGDKTSPNDLAITELLITGGADMNMKSDNKATPQSLARRGGKVEIADLLESTVPMVSESPASATAPSLVRGGHTAIVELLGKSGVKE